MTLFNKSISNTTPNARSRILLWIADPHLALTVDVGGIADFGPKGFADVPTRVQAETVDLVLGDKRLYVCLQCGDDEGVLGVDIRKRNVTIPHPTLLRE